MRHHFGLRIALDRIERLHGIVLMARSEIGLAKTHLRIIGVGHALLNACLDRVDRVLRLAHAGEILAQLHQQIAALGGVRRFHGIGEIGGILGGIGLRQTDEALRAGIGQKLRVHAFLRDGRGFGGQPVLDRKLGCELIILGVAHVAGQQAYPRDVERFVIGEAARRVGTSQHVSPVFGLAAKDEVLGSFLLGNGVARFMGSRHQQALSGLAAQAAEQFDRLLVIAHQIIGLRDDELRLGVILASLAKLLRIGADDLRITAGIVVGREFGLGTCRARAGFRGDERFHLCDGLLVARGQSANSFGLLHLAARRAGRTGLGQIDRLLQQFADLRARGSFGGGRHRQRAAGNAGGGQKKADCEGPKLLRNHDFPHSQVAG
jgi:hypothetical protein